MLILLFLCKSLEEKPLFAYHEFLFTFTWEKGIGYQVELDIIPF